jgi:uncharacterized protein HemX
MAIFLRLWPLWLILALAGSGFVWLKRHDHAIREEVRKVERAACDERFAKANAAADAENARLLAEHNALVAKQAEKYAELKAEMAADGKYYEAKLEKLRAAARNTKTKDQADAAANPMSIDCSLSDVAFGLRIDAIDQANHDPG